MNNDSGYSCNSSLPGDAGSLPESSVRQNTLTLGQALANAAERFGDATLSIQSALHGGIATLAALHRQSQALAGALHAHGIGQGDVVAVQMPNWFEGTLLMRAIAALGGVLLPINELCTPAQVGHLLRDFRAKALVIPEYGQGSGPLDRFAGSGAASNLEKLIVIGNDAPEGAIRWKDLLRLATPDFPAPAYNADDVAVLVHTAETAAAPKSASLSSRALLDKIVNYGKTVEAATPTLSLWPAGHIAGLMAQLQHALGGAPTILMEAWNASEAARLIERHQVGIVTGAPDRLAALLDVAENEGIDLGSLRAYRRNGETMSPILVDRCCKRDIELISDLT